MYGLVTLLLDTAAFLQRTLRDRASVALSMLVLIHNQEHQIEGVVRTLATHGWWNRLGGGRWEVLLVDLDSTDDTPIILQRLARQYEHVRLVTLPRDQAASACETALFLCRSPVTLLVDLRHNVNIEGLLRGITTGWQ